MVALRKPNRALRSAPVTVGAPVGGLNGRDGLANMQPTDAYVLDNWFPYNTSCDMRPGCMNHATGLPGPVEGLETYTGPGGNRMLAFCAGHIYDVTNADAPAAPLISGRISNQPVTCMFSNAGITVLLIYTGQDQPVMYDGASITPLVITGVTSYEAHLAPAPKRARKKKVPYLISYTGMKVPIPTVVEPPPELLPMPLEPQDQIFCAHVFKGRVLMGQLNTLGFWYLDVGAVQGEATFFDLSQQSLLGGSLLSIASISQTDAGVGPSDYAIFITTEGEYIMYSGIDPSDPTNWSLVARYVSGRPLGNTGWFKFRSDVYLMTEEGVSTVSELRQMGEEEGSDQYITAKLGRLYQDFTKYGTTHGWTALSYPEGNALILNMPTTSTMEGLYIQYVMNTNNGSWCRFTGWNALAWTLLDRQPYFGTYDGRIVQAFVGAEDNGQPITASCRQAWNNFDDKYDRGEMDKLFHFVSFAISADGTPPLSCALNVNFQNDPPVPVGTLTNPGGAIWDVSLWDQDFWAGTSVTQNFTVPVGKLGYVGSVWLSITAPSSDIRWYSTRFVMEKTDGILFQ